MVFLAVTAEEKGLLGSEYYADQPALSAGQDRRRDQHGRARRPKGPARNFTTSGSAKLGPAGRPDRRREGAKACAFAPDPHPEAGHFFRSDHFSFAKRGVPALSFGSGNDLVNGGVAAGEARAQEYTANHYHQPADEWSPQWDFTGMANDGAMLYAVGERLANSREWPNWATGQRIPRHARPHCG